MENALFVEKKVILHAIALVKWTLLLRMIKNHVRDFKNKVHQRVYRERRIKIRNLGIEAEIKRKRVRQILALLQVHRVWVLVQAHKVEIESEGLKNARIKRRRIWRERSKVKQRINHLLRASEQG